MTTEYKELEAIFTGFKATDKDMRCREFQFTLGEWAEIPVDQQLKLCYTGFHFCKYMSGIYSYYPDKETRVFKVEATGVLELPETPGADFKYVCRKIRLIKEVTPGVGTGNQNTGNSNTGDRNTGNSNTGNSNTGDCNTGDCNTGDCNTGNRNTGDWNTGNWNAGDQNTGDRNTGDRNTGYRNTGYWNTGDRNTGNRNTGDRNTGYWNTGDRNTGDRNTGYWNTGDLNTGNGNCCNNQTGSFCVKTPRFVRFDKPCPKDWEPDVQLENDLCILLSNDEPFDPTPFLVIPNATVKKIKILHEKHIEARKKHQTKQA